MFLQDMGIYASRCSLGAGNKCCLLRTAGRQPPCVTCIGKGRKTSDGMSECAITHPESCRQHSILGSDLASSEPSSGSPLQSSHSALGPERRDTNLRSASVHLSRNKHAYASLYILQVVHFSDPVLSQHSHQCKGGHLHLLALASVLSILRNQTKLKAEKNFKVLFQF